MVLSPQFLPNPIPSPLQCHPATPRDSAAVNLLGKQFSSLVSNQNFPGVGFGGGELAGRECPSGGVLFSKPLFLPLQKQSVPCTQHLTALRRQPRGAASSAAGGERPMSGAGEALAPGPQRGAEAGDGCASAPAQGECALASCKLLCHCGISRCVPTCTDWDVCAYGSVVW